MSSVANSPHLDAQLDAAVALRRGGRSTEAEAALRALVKVAPDAVPSPRSLTLTKARFYTS